MRAALDKRETYDRAAALGVAVPRSWVLNDLADLERVDGPPPYVVKPAIKERFFYATGVKAWRAETTSS